MNSRSRLAAFRNFGLSLGLQRFQSPGPPAGLFPPAVGLFPPQLAGSLVGRGPGGLPGLQFPPLSAGYQYLPRHAAGPPFSLLTSSPGLSPDMLLPKMTMGGGGGRIDRKDDIAISQSENTSPTFAESLLFAPRFGGGGGERHTPPLFRPSPPFSDQSSPPPPPTSSSLNIKEEIEY